MTIRNIINDIKEIHETPAKASEVITNTQKQEVVK